MGDIITLIQSITNKITAIAWSLFILTWSIGWTLRGAPIPFSKVKRVGSSFIEDSIWAAFWLAIGSSLFAFITYIVQHAIGGG
ncbi:MAG: hypothetical protein LRS46_00690 [Desulfurococcales archaeon]|nr:hypothetical protein [Desulfurococcales archaeon]